MDELWCRYSYVWVSIEVGIASTLSDLSPLLGCWGVQWNYREDKLNPPQQRIT